MEKSNNLLQSCEWWKFLRGGVPDTKRTGTGTPN